MAYLGLLLLSVAFSIEFSAGNTFCNCRDDRGDFSALQCEYFIRDGCGDGCRPQESHDEPTCISGCEGGDHPYFCSGRNQHGACGCFGRGNDPDIVHRMRGWLDQHPIDRAETVPISEVADQPQRPQPHRPQQPPPRQRNYYPSGATKNTNPELSWLMIESSFVMSVIALVVSGVTLAAFVGYLCQSTSPAKGGVGYRAVA
jgi:hypothetical protein